MRYTLAALVLVTLGCGRQSKTDQALKKGEQSLKRQNFADAIEHFTAAIELSPDSSEAYRGRSRAHFERGNLKDALSDCEHALSLNPKDAVALAIRGRIFLKQKKVDSAFAEFTRAIELQPDQLEARTWRAGIYLDRKQYAKAIEDCNQALKGDDGKYERKKFGQAYLFRSLALYYTGEHGRAEKDATLASAFDADPQGREVPCWRRKSKKFTFQDPKGGLRANVKHVVRIDAKAITWHRTVFRDNRKFVHAVEFSPDGRYVAYGGNDGVLRIRAVPDFNVVKSLSVPGYAIFDIEFSPNGRYLAAALVGSRTQVTGRNRAGQTLVRVWKTAGWRHLRDLPGRYTFVNYLTFSPNSQHLAASYSYFRTASRKVHEVSVWNVGTGVEHKRLHPGAGFVNSLAFSPTGQLVIGRGTVTRRTGQAVTTSGVAEIWNPYTGSKIASFIEKSGAVSALAFLDDGRKLVTGSRAGLVKVWDLKTRKMLLDEGTHTSWVSSLAISPDGRRIASGGGKFVHLLDARTGDLVTLLGNPSSRSRVPTHTDVIESVDFSPDGQFIASASRDATVRIWNVPASDVSELPRIDTYKRFKYPGIIKQALFSPDGELIAVGGTARTIVLASAKDGRTLATLKGHESEILDLAFSPDGTRLASAGGGNWDPDKKGEIKIWDVARRKLLSDLSGFEGPVVNVDYSPDGCPGPGVP